MRACNSSRPPAPPSRPPPDRRSGRLRGQDGRVRRQGARHRQHRRNGGPGSESVIRHQRCWSSMSCRKDRHQFGVETRRSKPQLICYIRRQPRQRDHLQPTLWRHALMMDDSLDDRRTADWRDEQQECVENDEPQDDSLLLLCHPWPAAQWLARRSPSSSLNVHRPLAPPVLRRLYSRSSRVRAGESGLARSEGGPSDRRCRDAREQQRAACRSDPTKLSVASTLSIERSDLAIQSSFH